MYVCMRIYIYICIRVCIYIYIYIYICISINTQERRVHDGKISQSLLVDGGYVNQHPVEAPKTTYVISCYYYC